MSANLTALALLWLPTAADGLSITPDATAWANTAWVELSASTPDDWTLHGLHVEHPKIAAEFEVDVGVGGAGSEVVVCTFRGYLEFGTSYFENKPLRLGIPISGLVPSGSRVALRLRKTGTDVTAWLFSLGYYEGAIGATNVIDTPQKTLPPAAVGHTMTDGTGAGWVLGVWVELLTPGPHVPSGTSETVIASVRGVVAGNCSPFTEMFEIPYFIPTGSKLSVRSASTGSGASMTVAGLYHDTTGGIYLTGFSMKRPSASEWEMEVGFVDGTPSTPDTGDPCVDGTLGPLAWVEFPRRIPD